MGGCGNCVTPISNNKIPGCRSNGGCKTDGCDKLSTFDWLVDMEVPPAEQFHIVEVRFKSGRKEYFKNESLQLTTGDPVVVDVPNGHHIGYVSMQGELVRLQMRKKNITLDENIRGIYRVATQRDIEKLAEVKDKESSTLYRTREIIQEKGLKMKLTDVEFQADNTKATFYYSAEERVDFRELIKLLASEFRIRIEMRQISLRQEAGRLGGIGSCGRELCCSTWLTDFKSVSTSAARYQNLSLNPGKLSGQCGRLKCCLNYELDTYMEALKDIPEIEAPLITEKGEAHLQKTDIFRKIMWFGYKNENTWIAVNVKRVKIVLDMNSRGKKPATLLEDTDPNIEDTAMALNTDLEALDQKFRKKGKKKNNRRRFKHKKKKDN